MQIYGLAEIAQEMGLPRDVARQWYRRRKLPPPTATLAMGPVWTATDIEKWMRQKPTDRFVVEAKLSSSHRWPPSAGEIRSFIRQMSELKRRGLVRPQVDGGHGGAPLRITL